MGAIPARFAHLGPAARAVGECHAGRAAAAGRGSGPGGPGAGCPELRKVAFVSAPRSDVSSHDLRQRVAAGQSIDGLAPPGVAALIRPAGFTGQPQQKQACQAIGPGRLCCMIGAVDGLYFFLLLFLAAFLLLFLAAFLAVFLAAFLAAFLPVFLAAFLATFLLDFLAASALRLAALAPALRMGSRRVDDHRSLAGARRHMGSSAVVRKFAGPSVMSSSRS